jgi:hypothetical protein
MIFVVNVTKIDVTNLTLLEEVIGANWGTYFFRSKTLLIFKPKIIIEYNYYYFFFLFAPN